MYSTQKLLEMINIDKSSNRYDACEWLPVSQESCPEIIYALQKASHDADPEVASRATYALQADVHHHLAVQLGLASPDERDLPKVVETASTAPQTPPLTNAQAAHLAMLKDIRSWGIWSLAWGGLSLITSGIFSSPWGILLIIVGLASFYFRTAAMYVIYGVTLAWAALQNLTGLHGAWILFSLFQVYATVRVFMNFCHYHKVELEVIRASLAQAPETLSASRAARAFPWIGTFLGIFSFIGFVFVFLLSILIAYQRGNSGSVPGYLTYLLELDINLGVLGFALGLAYVLANYRPKLLGILAIIAGSLTLLIDLGFIVLQFIA
jgi:hypothetical protein